jgi:drug/metabolite transporter (DMT)-like permease
VSSVQDRRPRRAALALLLVTLLWGCTFVWMKQANEASARHLGAGGLVAGVGLFMALRFGLAAVVIGLLPSVRRKLDGAAWRAGLWIGLALLGGFLLQMFGLHGVSPAVSAFLTSLYVLFTALLNIVRSRRMPHPALLLGAVLATAGAAFIGGPPQLHFDLGEWLTVGCAFVFAAHILITDVWTRRADPMAATLTCFVTVAAGALVTLLLGLASEGGPNSEALLALLGDRDFWVPLLLASLLATVLALSLMNLYQRDLDPVRAAILYAIEPIWAALFGIALGFDQLTPWLYFGGGALLCGNLVAELGPKLLRRARDLTAQGPEA